LVSHCEALKAPEPDLRFSCFAIIVKQTFCGVSKQLEVKNSKVLKPKQRSYLESKQ